MGEINNKRESSEELYTKIYIFNMLNLTIVDCV